MNKYILFLAVLFCSISSRVFGQDMADTLKYDWNPGIIGAGPVRGLEMSYHANTNYNIRSSSDVYGNGKSEIDYNRIFTAKLHFPIFLNQKLKIAGSIEYSDEEFHFDDISDNDYPLYKSLNDKNLKSVGGSLYLTAQLKRNMFFMFRFNAKLKGDYWKEHIGDVSRYTFLKMEMSPIIGWKVNSKKSWGIGMAYSYTFGDPLLFPVFVYNHSFADKWGVEALLPARIKLRYQPSKLCFINAKARLKGGSYSIHFNDPELNDFKTLELRRADLNFSLEIEKGITDWLWTSFECGYRTNINFDVTNSNHGFSLSGSKLTNKNSIIDSSVGGGVFYNFSVFIVPSKTLLKRLGLK
ncbi:DUF6268 family outer membrane beta-barrel protein [Labilibaculum sp. K2S]|uniref:DUF6268 family outer membrane beta-barrel protein n=1 Tax=Labilibaculum sp. K2S TaxID=3056386 RepID=UPI0025A43440|nr:DUF6268 family outer membrane beta-barrel protein [Labilibaculum sp. K2S]MDM8159688.1 DUF6268 family outer membrane beta-barrel protein [Labilibaculum sp. K2S]